MKLKKVCAALAVTALTGMLPSYAVYAEEVYSLEPVLVTAERYEKEILKSLLQQRFINRKNWKKQEPAHWKMPFAFQRVLCLSQKLPVPAAENF